MDDAENQIPDSVDLIDQHLDRFFDEEEISVFHEIESETIHSDVYIIKPAEDRPYYILLSNGMSALPMEVPEEADHLKYAEVMMMLPPDWNLTEEGLEDMNNYWPVQAIKQLSKLPHTKNTWLGYGHTLDNVDPIADNVKFTGIILLESIRLSEVFTEIENGDDTVRIYSVIPLYKEELEFKLKEGSSALLKKFEEFDIDEIVDINRRNVAI